MNNFKMEYISKKVFLNVCKVYFAVMALFMLPNTAFSTHIVGGNLTYKHVSGDVYQVKLVLRRDCFLGSPEAEFDNPAAIGIFTAGGALATWLANNGQLKLAFMSSDTLNEYIQSDCGFEGTQVCVHETTYQGNVLLPNRPGGYILAYQRCCRNASLNNVLDPLETGSTYWTAISEQSLTIKNSSPVFTQWPDVYICVNKPLIFDHGATDRDGDSLVYRLCTPSLGATKINPKPQPPNLPPYNNILFAPPYSVNDMMGGVPLKIDPKTGLITATPNLVGQFLIGLCVDEYRKGVLIGSVRRDFQYNVRVCSQPPKAKFTTSETNCDGLSVSFFNESLSSSNYQWDFNYPSTNPAFKSTEKNPVFTFPSSGIYTVRLRATRGTDGCFDTILQKVSVFENKIVPNFTYTLSGCDKDNDKLNILLADVSLFEQPGYAITDWVWEVTQNGVTKTFSGKTPTIDASYSGDITVKLLLSASNGCKSEFSKIIKIEDVIPDIAFNYSLTGCPTAGIAELTFNNLSTSLNPFAVIEFSNWTIAGQTFTGNPLTITLPANAGVIKASLENSFLGGCKIALEKSIDINRLLPNADYKFQPVSCPTDSKINLSFSYIDTLSNNIATNLLSWSVGTATNKTSFTGGNIGFDFPKDSLLYFDLIANFANGCSDTINKSFLPGPFATIKFLADPIILCPDQVKTFVTNPNPNWQYTWSPSTGLDLTEPSNPKVSIDQNITYNVTVTDGLCSIVSEVDILALTGGVVLTVSGDTTSCSGTVTLNADGGIGNGIYTWSTDENGTNVVGTGATLNTNFQGDSETFYVQFVGESCSTNPEPYTVKNQIPKIDLVAPNTLCKGDTIKINSVNLVTSHMNTYQWDPNPHIVSGANTGTPTITLGPNDIGPFVLYYTARNQFGCTLRDSISFNIGTNPTVEFDFTLKECGKYEVCFNTLGNFAGFIRWDFGDLTTTTDISIEKTPCYTYPSNGTFNVKLENLVGTCPFKDVTKTVIVNPQISLTPLIDKILCKGDSLNLIAASNLTPVEYKWYNEAGTLLVNGPKLATVINTDALFVVKAKDIYGCEVTDSVSATVFKFAYDFVVADSLCVNEQSKITLNIVNPSQYQYVWSPTECIVSGGNTNNPLIIGKEGKILTVLLTHIQTGCKQSDSITPKITKPFNFDIIGENQLCNGQPSQIMLQINNPEKYNFLWSPAEYIQSGATTASPTINIASDQKLTVLVTNKMSGCKEEKSFDATVGEEVLVDVDAEPDFTIYEGDTLDIFVSDIITGAKYSWSTNENGTTISVHPKETASYTVTVTDENGCTATDEVTVTVRKAQCDETDVFLPTAFSPNGDANNNILYVRSNFIDEMELIIYNRWGQEVFRSKDQNIGWDGTFKGEELSPDAYAYYLRVICINAVEYKKKGNVNLIR